MKEDDGAPNTDRDLELALSLHRNLNWAGRERVRHSTLQQKQTTDADKRREDVQPPKKRRLQKKGSADLEESKGGPKHPQSPAARVAKEERKPSLSTLSENTSLSRAVQRAWSLAQEEYRTEWDCVKCFVAGRPLGKVVPTESLASPSALFAALGLLAKDLTPEEATLVVLDTQGRSAVLSPPLDRHTEKGSEKWETTLARAERLYLSREVQLE